MTQVDVKPARADDNDALLHALAHDLRAPVRSITQFAELLRRQLGEELDATAARMLDFLTGGAEQIECQLADLLTFNAAQPPMEQAQTVSLSEALQQALRNAELLSTTAGEALSRVELPHVLGDSQRLTALFSELLSNSVTFVQPDQPLQVRLSLERSEQTWMLRWTDAGVGLDPKFGDQIFTPFRRLCSWSQHRGSGLGLPTARRHAEAHGGELLLEHAEPNAGCTFLLRLPVIDEA